VKNILGRFRSYLHETKELNRIYYEQEAFSDDIKEIQQDKERTSEIEKYGKERTFLISKINTLGQDRKLFTLYDCSWHFTDYADFS
jgi:hypothetical protein